MTRTSSLCNEILNKYAKNQEDVINIFLKNIHKPIFKNNLELTVWHFVFSLIFHLTKDYNKDLYDFIQKSFSKHVDFVEATLKNRMDIAYNRGWNSNLEFLEKISFINKHIINLSDHVLPLHKIKAIREETKDTKNDKLNIFIVDVWNIENIDYDLISKGVALVFPSKSMLLQSFCNSFWFDSINENSKFFLCDTDFEHNTCIKNTEKEIFCINSSYTIQSKELKTALIEARNQYSEKVSNFGPYSNEIEVRSQEYYECIYKKIVLQNIDLYKNNFFPENKISEKTKKRHLHIISNIYSETNFNILIDIIESTKKEKIESAVIVTNVYFNKPDHGFFYFYKQQSFHIGLKNKFKNVLEKNNVAFLEYDQTHSFEDIINNISKIIENIEPDITFFYESDPVTCKIAERTKQTKILIDEKETPDGIFDYFIYTKPIKTIPQKTHSKFIMHPCQAGRSFSVKFHDNNKKMSEFVIASIIENTNNHKIMSAIEKICLALSDCTFIVFYKTGNYKSKHVNMILKEAKNINYNEYNVYLNFYINVETKIILQTLYKCLPIVSIGNIEIISRLNWTDLVFETTEDAIDKIKQLKDDKKIFVRESRKSKMRIEKIFGLQNFYIDLIKLAGPKLYPNFF